MLAEAAEAPRVSCCLIPPGGASRWPLQELATWHDDSQPRFDVSYAHKQSEEHGTKHEGAHSQAAAAVLPPAAPDRMQRHAAYRDLPGKLLLVLRAPPAHTRPPAEHGRTADAPRTAVDRLPSTSGTSNPAATAR